jgi:hypothetical protein
VARWGEFEADEPEVAIAGRKLLYQDPGDLQVLARFFESEACALARARASTGYARYPVPQGDRDLLFAEARGALRAAT